MAYYYKYNFTSPESLYAIILEEMKSYTDTGAIDGLMFPSYVDKCLRKLGRSSYVISEKVLAVEDFEARLPDNFVAVREAWLCTEVESSAIQSPNSFYSQTDDPTTILIAPLTTDTLGCNNPHCNDPNCNGGCLPTLIQPVYKTNRQITKSYQRQYLLKPGNISARKNCDVSYTNEWDFFPDNMLINEFSPGSSTYDSFDIRDNKFVTNFRTAIVHLVFYSTDYDGVGNQMIPDNYAVREFIEAFIKFKMFETLTNQCNDETFNQLQQKLQYYENKYNEKFVLASTEIKRQTIYQKQRAIKRSLNRFRMYELPNRTNSSRLRRNS